MKRFAILVASTLLLSGCDSKPDGQVIATVNGEEITRTEFNDVLSSINLTNKANIKTIQNNVLSEMITQRLLTQAAKEEGLDKSQAYILQSRKSNDGILINLYGHKLAGALAQPYDQDIKSFIETNPWRFSGRTLYKMDQVRVRQIDFKPEWLKQANTLDEAIAALKSHNVPAERSIVTADSATSSKSYYDRANALAPGQAFPFIANGMVFISAILEKQPAPLTGDQAVQAATMLLRRQAAEQTLTNRVATLRKTAKIEYSTGFSAVKPAQ